jgi:ribonuclease E
VMPAPKKGEDVGQPADAASGPPREGDGDGRRRRRRRGRRGGRRHQEEGVSPSEAEVPVGVPSPGHVLIGPGHDLDRPYMPPPPRIEGPGDQHDWPWNRRAERFPDEPPVETGRCARTITRTIARARGGERSSAPGTRPGCCAEPGHRRAAAGRRRRPAGHRGASAGRSLAHSPSRSPRARPSAAGGAVSPARRRARSPALAFSPRGRIATIRPRGKVRIEGGAATRLPRNRRGLLAGEPHPALPRRGRCAPEG